MSKIQERIKQHLDVVQEINESISWKFEDMTDSQTINMVGNLQSVGYFFAHMKEADREYYQVTRELVEEYFESLGAKDGK